MGGINTGGGSHGGKKSLDSEIPLVPFIDLLLCCVMFLLVTAVWNKLARIDVDQQQPGQPQATDTPPPDERVKLVLSVKSSGYTLASTAGDSLDIAKNGENYDITELRAKLQERKRLEPNRQDIVVAPEDGVAYMHVVEAMDISVGEGFPEMSLSDGASL
ncbi:MAG: biopolymer transporter ExbD [Myxococcota bacterium]